MSEILELINKILNLVERQDRIVVSKSYWIDNTVAVEHRKIYSDNLQFVIGEEYILYSRDGLALHVKLSVIRDEQVIEVYITWVRRCEHE